MFSPTLILFSINDLHVFNKSSISFLSSFSFSSSVLFKLDIINSSNIFQFILIASFKSIISFINLFSFIVVVFSSLCFSPVGLFLPNCPFEACSRRFFYSMQRYVLFPSEPILRLLIRHVNLYETVLRNEKTLLQTIPT